MSALAHKRSTVYLDLPLHKALRLKAAQTETSISDLVNEAVRLALAEDAVDLEAIASREKETSRSFDVFVKELKRSGLL